MKTMALLIGIALCSPFGWAQDSPKDAGQPPIAQYRVAMAKGIITLSDVRTGEVMATLPVTVEFGAVVPTQNQLRKVALDMTAGVVVNKDGSRKHSVFFIDHDTYTSGVSYEAFIVALGRDEFKQEHLQMQIFEKASPTPEG
jgi:hypothetical protein